MREVARRARSRKWWQRQVRAAFLDRLALKAIALALAIVLWFSVTVREPAEEIIAVRFVPSLEPGITLQHDPAPIRALVSGSGQDILALYTTPPAIRMSIGGDVGDSLTLALRPSDVEIPPGNRAIVHDLQPRQLIITLGRARQLRDGGGAYARPAAPDEPATVTP